LFEVGLVVILDQPKAVLGVQLGMVARRADDPEHEVVARLVSRSSD